MKSFISAVSVVLSIPSKSLPVSTLPTDTSSGHLNVERGIRYLQNFGSSLSLSQSPQSSSITGSRLISVKVAYCDSSSNEPSYNIMQEINGKSNDINHDLGDHILQISLLYTPKKTVWIKRAPY